MEGSRVVYKFPNVETKLFSGCAIDGRTLRVEMVDGVLVEATTDDGLVRATPLASRNEILIHVLYLTVSLWVHPAYDYQDHIAILHSFHEDMNYPLAQPCVLNTDMLFFSLSDLVPISVLNAWPRR